ncbi:hypothetical protein PMZ80_009388 [Knufia obscura]|uniref:Non-structural maintenance of chromosomes element 4 n=1 Tax=Knufia obscura TaxID=1635080 RepID=A0ABR0RDT8_9EURO|nr:hypothetical protein PMZ80_009388 [Knufia obscura]
MARINNRESLVDHSFVAATQRQQRAESEASASPSESVGSDKENTGGRSVRSSLGKRKSTSATMSTPQPPSSTANKRRRLEEKGKAPASQARRRETGERADQTFYDPDQPEAIKSQTTKRLRDLTSLVNDSRGEFIQRGSRGIQNTIKEADEIIKDVKQTSTATIDSRLLVSVGDIAYKKISTMTLGDSSTGIDVDDFLTKCISYMKTTPTTTSTQPPSTQRRRQRRAANADSDAEDSDVEDTTDLNWSHLGRTLCFPANNRPCLSSFLLGPLSVQKKQRAQTQRRATQRANLDPATTTRPIQLDQEALDKQESASLTTVCSEIATLLHQAQEHGEAMVTSEVEKIREEMGDEDYDPPPSQIKSLMRKHNIADNGNVPLFHFCVNPKSFGQTIENFFYVSFLVKEGRVGLDFDSDGMPTLGMVEQKSVQERQESVRNQAVFTLDFEIWEELVRSCGIERCVIPHRRREEWEADDGVIRRGDASGRGEVRPGVDGETTSPAGDEANVVENDDLYG